VSKHGQTMEQVRDQTDEDLRASLVRTRDELFRLQLGQYTNQVTSTAGLQTKRRDIARLMTVLRGRQLGHEKQAQKKAEAAVVEDKDTKPAKKAKKTKAKS
jgi:large subunit ribosomal protein L29